MALAAKLHRQLRNVDIRTLARMQLNKWRGTVEPTVAIGGTKSKIQVSAALSLIDGVDQVALAAQDEALDTHTALGNDEACRLLVVCDASQNVITIQGVIIEKGVGTGVDSGESAAELKLRAELPAVPASRAVLGDVYIVAGAAETFTFGTDDFDTNATNATYRDLIWPDTGPDAFDLTIVGT